MECREDDKAVLSGLKITDNRSPVMMTGQIYFLTGQTWILAGQIMNTMIFFPYMEYQITLAIDRCTALTFRFLAARW